MRENEALKEALRKEQKERTCCTQESLELGSRLRLAEKQAAESEDIRYKLSIDIQTLQGSLRTLARKCLNDHEIAQTCASFLRQNALLAASFISDDSNPF